MNFPGLSVEDPPFYSVMLPSGMRQWGGWRVKTSCIITGYFHEFQSNSLESVEMLDIVIKWNIKHVGYENLKKSYVGVWFEGNVLSSH